jgi:L-threonylcarbamoyladenylate synthase
MRTLRCPEGSYSEDCNGCEAVEEATRVLDGGGLVVFPTDTVYGLAGKALDPGPVEEVFKAKGRPMDQPLPIAVSSIDEIYKVAEITTAHVDHLKELMGLPLTIILPARSSVPTRVVADTGKVGIRVMTKGCAQHIIKTAGPIIATSANLHGDPPSCTVEEAIGSLGESVDLYIDGGPSRIGIPTTVMEPLFKDEGKGPVIFGVRIIREGSVEGTLIEDRLLKDRG